MHAWNLIPRVGTSTGSSTPMEREANSLLTYDDITHMSTLDILQGTCKHNAGLVRKKDMDMVALVSLRTKTRGMKCDWFEL